MVGEEYNQQFMQPDEVDQEIDQEFAMEEGGESQQELQSYDDLTPQYSQKDDLYSLFWKVVNTRNSSKVGNLDMKELGLLNMTVRDCQRIALLAYTLGHPGFARFFEGMSEIILSTSASKAGWLPELFVSQKRLSTKTKGLQISERPPQEVQRNKKGLFVKKR